MRANIPYDPRHGERVPTVEQEEIDSLLQQTLSDFDATNEEIQKLSIECVSNLSTSKALSRKLSEQGSLKRIWFNFTGRNQKLQSAINRSHSHSMYANQQLLILLMEQNKSAMEFSLHLDQKQHMINLDFSEQLFQQNQDIQHICQVLQRFDYELNGAVFKCEKCNTFLQRESVICPNCGKKRTQITDPMNTDLARKFYQKDLDALSDAVSRKALLTADPIHAAYSFARLSALPEHFQEQIDAMYTDTTAKIDALKLHKISFLQRFQKEKVAQRNAYHTKFLRDLREITLSEKEIIDETLDQFDHLDDQVAQFKYAIANLKKQCGGEW